MPKVECTLCGATRNVSEDLSDAWLREHQRCFHGQLLAELTEASALGSVTKPVPAGRGGEGLIAVVLASLLVIALLIAINMGGSDPAPSPSPDPPSLSDECNWDELEGWERSNYSGEAEYLRICRQVMEDVEDGDFVDGLSGG